MNVHKLESGIGIGVRESNPVTRDQGKTVKRIFEDEFIGLFPRKVYKIIFERLVELTDLSYVKSLKVICKSLCEVIEGVQILSSKIGEMLIIGFHESVFDLEGLIGENIKRYHVGGVILYGGAGLGTEKGGARNIESPEQLVGLTKALQEHGRKHRLKEEGDLFISIDHEGGEVVRLFEKDDFSYENISPKELGSMNDRSKTFEYAESLGRYLKGFGINLNFAPVVDLGVNPDNFIYKRERCFSDNPEVVYEQGDAFVEGMHKNGIETALKHFAGHGSSFHDTHYGVADVSQTWTKKELEPYIKFIEKGYRSMIMSSHVINKQLDDTCLPNKNGELGPVPATFSKKMITDLLRNKLGFQGVVITDDMTMGAIADQYEFEDALKYAINAGVDMIILANHKEDQTGRAVEIIQRLVEAGEISIDRIDEAYGRIMNLKKGLNKELGEL